MEIPSPIAPGYNQERMRQMPEYALRPRMRRHLSVQTHPAIQDRYSEFRAKDCIMHTVLLIALIVIVVIVIALIVL